MILVEITKDGIEKVCVRSACEAEQDLDLKIWPLVRRGLIRLSRDLARRQGSEGSTTDKVKKLYGQGDEQPPDAA